MCRKDNCQDLSFQLSKASIKLPQYHSLMGFLGSCPCTSSTDWWSFTHQWLPRLLLISSKNCHSFITQLKYPWLLWLPRHNHTALAQNCYQQSRESCRNINNIGILGLLLAKNCTLLILTVIHKRPNKALVLQPAHPYSLCMLLLPPASYRSHTKQNTPCKALLFDISGHKRGFKQSNAC